MEGNFVSRVWGIISLFVAFVWQLYTLWLLIQLHESVPGTRYSRYLRLSMAAFGIIHLLFIPHFFAYSNEVNLMKCSYVLYNSFSRGKAGKDTGPVSNSVPRRWNLRKPHHDGRKHIEDLLSDCLWWHLFIVNGGMVHSFRVLSSGLGSASQPEFHCWSFSDWGNYGCDLLHTDVGFVCLQN